MKMRTLAIVVALVAAIVAGCSAALVPPTPDDARWAASRWPETSLADLEQGRAVYVERCAGCHNLYRPEQYAATNWPEIVAYMAKDANLTGEEIQLITRYLVSTSARLRGELDVSVTMETP